MTTIHLQPETDTVAERATLRERFARLAMQVRLRLAVDGAAKTLWVLVAAVVIGAFLDHSLELSIGVRALYWLITLAAVAHAVFHDLIRPLRTPMGPVDLAAALDRCEHAAFGKELAPRVASVFQLDKLRDGIDQPSPDMIALAVRRELDALTGLDLHAHLDQQRFLRHGLSLATAVLLPLVLVVAMPTLAGVWAQRWLGMSDTPWPRSVAITVLDAKDGRIVVPRGEPFVLRAQVTHAASQGTVESVRLDVRTEAGKSETVSLSKFAKGDFRHDFGPVTQGLTLHLRAGDGRAGPIEIVPADRPRITELELVAKHPRDEEPTVRTFAPGDGDLALLPHTEAKLTLSANVPIVEPVIRTESGEPMPAVARLDDRTFMLSWTHEHAVRLNIELLGEEALLASYPVPLSIGLRTDRPPRVSLRREHVKSRVTPQATIPLIIAARDDQALRALRLEIERDDPSRAALEVEAARRAADRERAIREAEAAGEPPPVFDDDPETEADRAEPRAPIEPVILFGPVDPATELTLETTHDLALSALDLKVGELLRLTAVATDDRYGGPQDGRSRVLTFRITSPEELFREILLRQQALRARFRKARTSAEELRDVLAVYTGEPQQAKALLAKHRLAQRAVWQVSRSLNESAEEMRLNQLGGEEAYELLKRYVLEPMNRLHDQTLTQQRQSLQSLSEGKDTDLAAVATRQERVLDDMDAILKAMNQWDSFIDVVNQLNEIIKIQEEVKKFTEKLQEEQNEDIFED